MTDSVAEKSVGGMFDKIINKLASLRDGFVKRRNGGRGKDDLGNTPDVLAGVVAELGYLIGIIDFL